MLIERIYGLLWLFVAIIGGILFLTDSFNAMTVIVFGFIAAALAGAGIIAVFPAMMHERVSSGRKARYSRANS